MYRAPDISASVSRQSLISASHIALPLDFHIHFATFDVENNDNSPSNAAQVIHAARRLVYEHNRNHNLSLPDALLSYSHLTRNTFWLFAIDTESVPTRISALDFPGLIRTRSDSFSYSDIFPCSDACASQRQPCVVCSLSSDTDSLSFSTNSPSPSPFAAFQSDHVRFGGKSSPASHFPRTPLRQPLAFLLHAITDAVCDDMAQHAHACGSTLRRMGAGLLYGLSGSSSTWADDWGHTASSCALMYCQPEVTLLRTGITMQPRFKRTAFLPFQPSPSPGTPIHLLPFSTPAYYLNMYTGPTLTLARHFQTALQSHGTHIDQTTCRFVIAWVAVQNRNGDEKGLMVIWPADLCLSLLFAPKYVGATESEGLRYAYNRERLAYIPELPPALQPSPIPAPATVPVPSQVASPHDSLFSPSNIGPNASRSLATSPTSPNYPSLPPTGYADPDAETHPARLPLLRAPESFSPQAVLALKTLTVSDPSNRDLRTIAQGSGKFVEFLAKERDRERERIRREKEAANASVNAPSGPAQQVKISVPTPPTAPSTSGASVAAVVEEKTPEAREDVDVEMQTRMGFTHKLPMPGTDLRTLAVDEGLRTGTGTSTSSQISGPQASASYPSPPDEPMHQSLDNAVSNMDVIRPQNIDEDVTMAIEDSNLDVEGTEGDQKGGEFSEFDGMADFAMDLIDTDGGGGAGRLADSVKVDFDVFGDFTDDDFNFFDEVSSGPPPPATKPDLRTSAVEDSRRFGLTELNGWDLGAGASPSGPVDIPSTSVKDWSTPGVTHPSVLVPDLTPDSEGGQSVASQGPVTPGVVVSDDVVVKSGKSDINTDPFSAINFASRLVELDGKYSSGKFSSELLDLEHANANAGVEKRDAKSEWQRRYLSLTDPRISVVKRLIGVKRKLEEQDCQIDIRYASSPPSLYFQRREWDDTPATSIPPEDSEKDSDEEFEPDLELDFDRSHPASTPTTRPSTPLPSHLPAGPSLIPTHLSHSLLLPLSSPLRPPNAPFTSTLDLTTPLPNPAPTPVSPAAAVMGSGGATSEKIRAWEACVKMLCVEILENGIFREAWGVQEGARGMIWEGGVYRGGSGSGSGSEVFGKERRAVVGWSYGLASIEGFLSSAQIANHPNPGSSTLSVLEQPAVCVGKAGNLISANPSSLRFWSKLGLTPRSGRKDLTTFLVHEGSGQVASLAEAWMKRVASLYSAKGFGTQRPGVHRLSNSGIIQVQHATFRKTIASVLDTNIPGTSLLIYVVIPQNALSLSSPTLRQLFIAARRALPNINTSDSGIKLHFIPELALYAGDEPFGQSRLEAMVTDIYERVPRPTDRFITRPPPLLTSTGERERRRKWFKAPLFTLARPSAPSVSLKFEKSAAELVSVDRHTLLHIGYMVCGSWVFVACVDGLGEMQEFGCWRVGVEEKEEGEGEGERERDVVGKVWKFSMGVARLAGVEWRVAIAKVGSFGEDELKAWNTLLAEELRSSPPMHVSLLCVETEPAWSALPLQVELSPPPLSRSSTSTSTSTNHHHHQIQSNTHAQSQQSQFQTQSKPHLLVSACTAYMLSGIRCPVSAKPHKSLPLSTYGYVPEDETAVSTVSGSDTGTSSSASGSGSGPPTSAFSLPLESASLIFTLPSSSSSPSLSFAPSSTNPSSSIANPNSHPQRQTQALLLHLYQTAASARSSYTNSVSESFGEVVRSLYGLSVLAGARQGLGSSGTRKEGAGLLSVPLPYHLEALLVVDGMLCLEDGILDG